MEARTREERRRFEEEDTISDLRLGRRLITGHIEGGLLKTLKAFPLLGGSMFSTSSPPLERRKISCSSIGILVDRGASIGEIVGGFCCKEGRDDDDASLTLSFSSIGEGQSFPTFLFAFNGTIGSINVFGDPLVTVVPNVGMIGSYEPSEDSTVSVDLRGLLFVGEGGAGEA
jgi:hypothetical protein